MSSSKWLLQLESECDLKVFTPPPSPRAGSHLGAHARAAKSEFKSEVILQGVRESEPTLTSVNFSLPPSNRRNEIIQLNFTANLKFDSKVDSPLTPQCQISWEISWQQHAENQPVASQQKICYKRRIKKVSSVLCLAKLCEDVWRWKRLCRCLF